MSKKWFEETGGLDRAMAGWGGENIDQSLRIWLCGGEIVSAHDSVVAHMWRDPEKQNTVARYVSKQNAVAKNRFRAATAWYGEYMFFFPFFKF